MSRAAKNYFERYEISHIELQMQPGVVDSAERVCNLTLKFERGYQVQFKLLGEQSLLGEKITGISPDGSIATVNKDSTADLEDELLSFFHNIESRLDRIEHEEKVQSITFLGNTFILNNKTVFDVVEDDGGRLIIEMHRGDKRQSAKLLASSLLDGLYDGSIVLKS
ncbi:MAG: hypothetical protein IMF06_11035 [Proteobacteria bacterium]|nr:hypothetical protein [Pseudomonadota bacterium]